MKVFTAVRALADLFGSRHARIISLHIEREEKYCEVAAQRLRQDALPLDFSTAPEPAMRRLTYDD
jgi:hypothetical protein